MISPAISISGEGKVVFFRRGEGSFPNSRKSLLGYGFIFYDIIAYHANYMNKVLLVMLSPRFVLIMFSEATISVVSRKFDSDNIDFV